jgi:hypothetical protein
MDDGFSILIKGQHFQASFLEHPNSYPLGDLGGGEFIWG